MSCPQTGMIRPPKIKLVNPKNLSGRARLDSTRCRTKSQSVYRQRLCDLFVDVVQIDVVENAFTEILIVNHLFGFEPHLSLVFRLLHIG